MKNLNLMTDDELHFQTQTASTNEKSATLILLDHLAEIDHQRTFARFGFSSLWEYCHKALHYSEAQSSERVNAVRLIAKVPEVKRELIAGTLALTATAKLASHVRREKCAPSETLQLLQLVVGKSSREVERFLGAESTTPARPDQVRVISQETTRITIDVDQKFLELMKRVQELSGHPGSSAQELFKTALQDFVKRRKMKIQPEEKNNETGDNQLDNTSSGENGASNSETSLRAITSRNESASFLKGEERPRLKTTTLGRKSGVLHSRYIAKAVKIKIRIRSGDRCEYIGPTTKRRCECKMKLQFDHIQAFGRGGLNTFENLRHYCATHNQFEAIQSFGQEKMQRHFKI